MCQVASTKASNCPQSRLFLFEKRKSVLILNPYSSVMPMLLKFLHLTWLQRARLVEALYNLALARLTLVLVPFNRLAARLGEPQRQSPDTLTPPAQAAQARSISWAVTTMSRLVPWDSACLAQAIAAKWMLQKRGLASTLYLGVAYDQNKKMLAHAWLRCGDIYVTGAPQHRSFAVVTTFADTAPTDPTQPDLSSHN